MTKVVIKGPAAGTGSYTLNAPETASELSLEMPITGTHLAGAQADGMPLGPGGDPVVESGSNSDGSWVRWADGTQIVTREDSFTGESSTANNNVYSFPVKSTIRNMPQTFISVPNFMIHASTFAGSSAWGASGGNITTSEFASEVRCMLTVASSSDYRIQQTAIGRWK